MLRQVPRCLFSACRSVMTLTALGAALGLAACAQLPDLESPAQPRRLAAVAADASFRAGTASWPAERWWTAYGDAQLDALVEEALAGSPDLAAAAARLQRAQAFTQLADSALKPRLSAQASVSEDKLSYHYLTPTAATPKGWNDFGRATLNFQWELDFWGRNRAGLAAATSELEAGRAELAQARLLLAAGVASQYAELGRLHANRETAQRSVALRGKTATLLQERWQHGLETRAAVREAEARLAMAQGSLLALDEQLALQRNRISALLGAGPDRGLSIAVPARPSKQAFGLPPQLALELLGRRPDIAAARLQAEAQSSRIELKRAEFYPNVNLSAFIGVQSLGLDWLAKNGSGIGSVGPAISLPLFTGGRLQGELRGAQAAHAEAVARYDAAVANALREVADAAVSLQALGPQLAAAQQAVDAAAEAHRIVQQRYVGGLSNYLEVLSAEDGLLSSLTAQSNLRSRSFTLDIALQRALGGGYQTAQR